MEVLWAETTVPLPIPTPTHAQSGEKRAGLCLFTWSEKGKGEGKEASGGPGVTFQSVLHSPLPLASDGPWASLSGKVMASGLKQLSR